MQTVPPTFNFNPTSGGPENDVESVALHWARNPVQTVPPTFNFKSVAIELHFGTYNPV